MKPHDGASLKMIKDSFLTCHSCYLVKDWCRIYVIFAYKWYIPITELPTYTK